MATKPGGAAALAMRAAAAVALVQAAGHAWLFLNAKPTHGAAEVEVIELMKARAFDFSGAMDSYWSFYWGYGLMVILTCLVQAVLFWLLAGPIGRDPRGLRPVAALYLAAYLGHAFLAWRYFFMTPVIFDLLVAALLLAVFVLAGGERRTA